MILDAKKNLRTSDFDALHYVGFSKIKKKKHSHIHIFIIVGDFSFAILRL